jgi:hypothetical protein
MDSTAHLLYAANELHARSGMGGETGSRPASYKIIGLILAIASGVFIGTSFVIKKHGLLQANEKYNEEAGEGYGYLKNAWWWLGMTLMILGEASIQSTSNMCTHTDFSRYVTLSHMPLPMPSS